MVDFRPFRPFIPRLGSGERMLDRVSPPYDVISAEELGRLKANRFNVTNITLGGVDGDYSAAGLALSSWIEQGALAQDRRDAFYTYRQTFCEGEHYWQRTGIVGIMAAEGYSERVVPHEETFPKVKEDRLNLLRGTGTHCESIFGIFDELSPGLRDRMDEVETKVLEFTDPQGVRHCLFRVCDPETVAAVSQELAGKTVLIADGHHRYETASRYAQESPGDERRRFVLTTLVPSNDPGLLVFPTHRLVKALPVPAAQFLAFLRGRFELLEVPYAAGLASALEGRPSSDVGLVVDGKAFVASPKDLPSDPMWELDSYVCQELVLKGEVWKEGPQVVYEHDTGKALGKAAEGFRLLVMLRSPSVDKIWELARMDRRMPKKSTYFWPKIWSGFVYYRMA
ncbi:MAG TPA: DUF1015 domain-containing protein [Methanomassiliicoccales archaeon]|mgnify:FL=1|nr:DUF1015 domain-containing protein [Methanomassiliicoccales archaeon]